MTSVTIVIPTFRRPADLAVAIASCMDQTGLDGVHCDVLVVDNAPEASARAMVADLAALAPHPLRYAHEPRPGVSHARNTGARLARTDIVAFLDDDSYADANWIAATLRVLEAHHGDLAFVPLHPVVETVNPEHASFVEHYFTRSMNLPSGGLGVPTWGPGLVFRRSAIDGMEEPFDPRLGASGGEDSFFLQRLAQRGARMVYCPETRIHERYRAERTTPDYILRRTFKTSQTFVRQRWMLSPWNAGSCAKWMAVGAAQLLLYLPPATVLWLAGSPRFLAMARRAAAGGGKLLWLFGSNRGAYAGGRQS